jgi:hypothetical protein
MEEFFWRIYKREQRDYRDDVLSEVRTGSKEARCGGFSNAKVKSNPTLPEGLTGNAWEPSKHNLLFLTPPTTRRCLSLPP